ncbi:cyclic lactone autoinducer peptide, partial [Faecalibacillus intestinalis]
GMYIVDDYSDGSITIYQEIIMKERSKNRVKKAVSKKACDFLNSLAYTSCSSYSFVGPYEPKKPEKLKK